MILKKQYSQHLIFANSQNLLKVLYMKFGKPVSYILRSFENLKKNAKDEKRNPVVLHEKTFAIGYIIEKYFLVRLLVREEENPYLTIKLTVCDFERSTKFHGEVQHCSFGRTQIVGNCHVPNYYVHLIVCFNPKKSVEIFC